MSIEKELSKLKSEIDKELENFFDLKIRQIRDQKKPPELLKMTENLKTFILNSGKRIRPILFYYGYIISGGRKKKYKIIKTAISVELIHSYLIIHDDIIDQDNFRHGNFSIHYKYEREYNTNKPIVSNAKHLGVSMAIIIGDLAAVFGYEILNSSDFDNSLKVKAVDKLNRIVSDTTIGQALDLILEISEYADPNDISEMQRYKTAKYTIEGPLHLGAILAGANKNFLRSLSRFAIPIGIAFQIQDDIIGIFGSRKKTGKSVGADIKEGKKTLLITKALEKANSKQKAVLNSALGNRNITAKEINQVRNIIKDTGSLEFSRRKAERLIKISKKHIKKANIKDKYKEFLISLADFVAKREY